MLCPHVANLESAAPSFEVVLEYDYYDGFAAGVVRCRGCAQLYYLRAIALFGGKSVGSRVFVLSPMPKTSDKDCVKLRAEAQKMLSRRPAEDWNSRPDLRERMEALGRRRRSPARIICWDVYENRLLASRELPSGESLPRDISAGETADLVWFKYLGIAAHAA